MQAMNTFLRELARHILPPRLAIAVRKLAEKSQIDARGQGLPLFRSDEELVHQNVGLREICDVLDAFQISYFIGGGALLGAIREGDFIKWDPDVDIDVKVEEVYSKQDELIAAMKEKGFDISYHDASPVDFKIIATKLCGKYEVTGYIKMGKKRYRKRCCYPDIFCSDKSEIVIRGERYNTYCMPEKYLEWFYGDWKTPQRIGSASYYVTSDSRTSPLSLLLIEFMSLFK